MSRAAVVALLICLTVVSLSFANSLSSSFAYDDRFTVVENQYVRSLRQIPRFFSETYWAGSQRSHGANYRPLVLLTLAVDHAFWGLQASGFHATNLLLHLAAVAMAFVVALRLKLSLPAAVLCATLFGVHPLQTEAVNAISNRGDLLAAFFLLATLALYIRNGDLQPSFGRLALLWAAYALACLSKETGIATLGVLLAHDWLVRCGGDGRRLLAHLHGQRWIPVLGLAAVASAYLLIRRAVVGPALGKAIGFLENPLAHEPTLQAKMLALSVAGKQAGLLLWPSALSADYSYHAISLDPGLLSASVLSGSAVLGGCIGLVFFGAQRLPLAAFAAAFFLATYILTSNLLFPVDVMMAERFMTLPLFAFSLGVAQLCQGMARWLAPRRSPALVVGSSALLLTACASRTWARNADWHDTRTLLEAAVTVCPDSAKVHFGLGQAYDDAGDRMRAASAYARATEIWPGYGDAWSDLSLALSALGRHGEAVEAARRSTRLSPMDHLAWNNLGFVLYHAGSREDAARAWERALEIRPGFPTARNNLDELAREGARARALRAPGTKGR